MWQNPVLILCLLSQASGFFKSSLTSYGWGSFICRIFALGNAISIWQIKNIPHFGVSSSTPYCKFHLRLLEVVLWSQHLSIGNLYTSAIEAPVYPCFFAMTQVGQLQWKHFLQSGVIQALNTMILKLHNTGVKQSWRFIEVCVT